MGGFGQTVMSNQDIVFALDNGLKPGIAAEVVLAWPFLFDNRIRLQLVLQVMITGSGDGLAEALILAYDFRIARPAEALGWSLGGRESRLRPHVLWQAD